jgi:hypothetical protein
MLEAEIDYTENTVDKKSVSVFDNTLLVYLPVSVPRMRKLANSQRLCQTPSKY